MLAGAVLALVNLSLAWWKASPRLAHLTGPIEPAVIDPGLRQGPPIDVRPLLAEQQAAFVDLLRRLDTDEWAQPTICPGWSVKDVAAHVLGDHIGRLSIHRDSLHALHPRDGEAFPTFLDRINDERVNAARHISPPILIELPSTWTPSAGRCAGPVPNRINPYWLAPAREYTEYWTHHQRICDATGRTGLTDPHYLGPVLDTFLRALPHTLREVTAPQRATSR